MLDVVSGRLLQNASVVVTGDRITAVNPASVPAGARVVDLGDVTLLPGLMDLHTHLAGELGPAMFTAPVTDDLADATLHAVKNGRTTIMAGFTTVRDFGGDATVALGHAVDRGDVIAPRESCRPATRSASRAATAMSRASRPASSSSGRKMASPTDRGRSCRPCATRSSTARR